VRAGILEDRGDRPDLVAAILNDTTIGERQKQVLVDIYRTFQREHETGRSEVTPAEAH